MRRSQLVEIGMYAIVWLSGLSVLAIFMLLTGKILGQGIGNISFEYFITPPTQAGLAGGVSSILIGTVMLVITTLAIVLPLSLGTAIFSQEFVEKNSFFQRLIQRSFDILAGVPSIVFGLFGLKFFCEIMGLGWSILSGALTLACMILPLTVRAAEEGLRSVPASYRLGCAALGLSKWSSLRTVLLPYASPAILAGSSLGIGRALAETAVVMFTAGAATRMPTSLLDSSRTLAYHVYIMSIQVPGGTSRSYTASLTLILLIMVVSFSAHWGIKRLLKN